MDIKTRICSICTVELDETKFRIGRTKCKKCCSASENLKLREKNYFIDKYIEKKDRRLAYAAARYETIKDELKEKRKFKKQQQLLLE